MPHAQRSLLGTSFRSAEPVSEYVLPFPLADQPRLRALMATIAGQVAEWQTRTVQVRVSVRTWGFDSPLAHTNLGKPRTTSVTAPRPPDRSPASST